MVKGHFNEGNVKTNQATKPIFSDKRFNGKKKK